MNSRPIHSLLRTLSANSRAANEPSHAAPRACGHAAACAAVLPSGGLRQHGRPRLWLRNPAPAGGRGAKPVSPLDGLRVLLVDDSAETLDVFSMLLRLEGAEVITAGGAHEALRLVELHEFDLILSDLGMPGMDGYALIRRLREHPRTRRVTALALSGFGERAGIERALAEGFQAYLAKPVTLDALREALARIGAGIRESEAGREP